MNRPTSRWLKAATLLMATAPATLITTTAQAQDQLWLRQFGTSGGDDARALAPDGAGGVMVAGSVGYSNTDDNDVFLARFDGAGNRLWIEYFGSPERDWAAALASDGTGGVMVAGSTQGSLGGPNAGRRDIFLARYDSAGNLLWIRQFGTPGSESPFALAPDGAGGVMVAGWTTASLGGPQAGRGDVFLARYDGAGDQLWLRQFGTSEYDYAWALAPDGEGGVMIAGDTAGSLGGSNAGESDAFLARYDRAGNQLWIRQFGTSEHEIAYALAPDGAGGVMVAGYTEGSLGGPNAVDFDAFLARYDGHGNQLWITQFGSSGTKAYALAPYDSGGVIVAGITAGSPAGPSAGNEDVILACYDSAGNQLWIRQFGTRYSDVAYALAPDNAGGVMVAGYTEGSLGGPNVGFYGRDIFVARFGDFGCYHADCDPSTGVGVLDMLDFLCFQSDFVTGNSYACDCDTTTGLLVCDIFDFLCFQDAFVAGCP